MASPSNAAPWGAIVVVWLSWGTTYLAIRWAVETVPPWLMAGARVAIAGVLLYAWARVRGAPAPTMAQWRAAFTIGFLMLVCGNGLLVWAERTVPSGLAALVIGASPFYFAVLDWGVFRGPRPGRLVALGLVVGLAGLAILIGPDLHSRGVQTAGLVALLFANVGWVFGSLYSRQADTPASPVLATAMQMVGGSVALLTMSGLLGEWRGFSLAQVSVQSAWSVVWLVVVGSWLGWSAYTVTLRHAPTALASTYAFVNPVVAVIVGWALGGETIGSRMLVASAVVIAGVILVTFGSRLRDHGVEG
jgi:drug/metabolite transporter (DMT)-like permease